MPVPAPRRPSGPAGYAALLRELLGATDAVATAVEAHDRLALETANARAEQLCDEVGHLVANLDPDATRSLADPRFGLAQLIGSLRASGRRNALLIERTWALDAATTRLLASLAISGTAPSSPYAVAPTATAVERRA